MDMAERADDAAFQRHAPGRAFQRATRSVRDVAALANRRMNSELELLGHGTLDLGIFASRSQDPNALDSAFWSDDGKLFLAGVLARLRKVGLFRQLVTWTEERFDVFLGEMNVMRRDLDQEGSLLLRLQRPHDVGPA